MDCLRRDAGEGKEAADRTCDTDERRAVFPGGMAIHNCMTAHGPDLATFQRASEAQLKPHKIENTLAFMWESRYVFRPTRFALSAPQLQKDYDKVWDGFKKLYK